MKQTKIDATKHPFEPAPKIIWQGMENEIQPPQYEALPSLITYPQISTILDKVFHH